MGERPIGWFHSHPEWGGGYGLPELSENDLSFAKVGEVVVVAAIRAMKRELEWEQHADGTISGILGGYHITLGAYYKNAEHHAERLRLFCPYAHGLAAWTKGMHAPRPSFFAKLVDALDGENEGEAEPMKPPPVIRRKRTRVTARGKTRAAGQAPKPRARKKST